MSPPRRRSSRLAGISPVKGKAAPELPSVTESNDTTDSPSIKSPKPVEKEHALTRQPPQTPTAPRIEPSREEMHPSLYHNSTMPEPSSALRLGFTDVRPGTVNGPAAAQGTPTRTSRVPSSEFTFRFAQGAAQAPLSENAQRLMNELREQANKIKVEMRAQREAEGDVADRKIAQPKGKASRFSAAHMAEFKKMDSIENHASAWRVNRTPPVVNNSELKHSASKSSLLATPTAVKPSLKRTLSKANLDGTPQSKSNSALKRSSSRAKLDDGEFKQPDTPNFSVAGKPRTMPADEPKSSFAKRIKKFQEEDTSMSRPISRDGSTIPRPTSSGKGLTKSQSTSSFSRLTSPTKASIGHSSTPTKSTISLVKSPSRSELGGLAKSSTTSNLATTASASKTAELRRRIISPGRFQKVKSILRGQKSTPTQEARTALPKPAMQMSKTPGPTRVTVDKELPPLPLTTPRRKLVKHVAFTPDTKHAAEQQDSPSPQKFAQQKNVPTVQYPTLDGVLAQSTQPTQDKEVAYPDLSPLRDITDVHEDKRKSLPKSVPGTFSFRSDHTIDFGTASPSGFGSSPGQASLRHVRASSAPKGMPGAFPSVPEPSTHPNKENAAPTPNRKGISHGLSNKKRHRAPSEEGDVDREGEERGGKKQKSAHGTPAKSNAPRLASTPVSSIKKMAPGRTPSRTPGSATPSKKKGGLSLSRLNMLARPKQRT